MAVYSGRKQERVIVHNVCSDIAINERVCNSDIDNVSINGMHISRIPIKLAKLCMGSDICVVIISLSNKNIKLKVRPKWYSADNNMYAGIGFVIAGYSSVWNDYVSNLLPDTDDVWSTVSQRV